MKITKKHKKAIELLISGELTKEEIANCVKVSRKTLYNWIDDPDFAAEYDEQLAEINRRQKRRIYNMVDKALDTQERILEKSKNDIAAASVASDVLDRAGYKPDDKVSIEAAAPVQIIYDIPEDGNRDAEG